MACTGHSLLATKIHEKGTLVAVGGDLFNEEMIVLQIGTIDFPEKDVD